MPDAMRQALPDALPRALLTAMHTRACGSNALPSHPLKPLTCGRLLETKGSSFIINASRARGRK